MTDRTSAPSNLSFTPQVAPEGEGREAQPTYRFDAFISYSRKDIAFARRLHEALSAYRPPKDLPVPQRALRIFRDETDFVGPEYHASLDRSLKDAATLVVLCSPQSAASAYVADEIARFAEQRGIESVVTVLLDGVPNNEANGEPGQHAFAEALVRRLPIPLAADYRGFDPSRDHVAKGRFMAAWFKLLADIYGHYKVDRHQIEQREQRRRAERLRNWALFSGALAVVLAGLTVWALVSRYEATVQRNLATAGQHEAEARLAFDISGEGFIRATLLAAASLRSAPTTEGQVSMRRFLDLLPRPPSWRHGGDSKDRGAEEQRPIGHGSWGLSYSPDGTRIASARADRSAIRWLDGNSGADAGALSWPEARPTSRTTLAFSPDGAVLAVGCGRHACVIGTATNDLLMKLPDEDSGQGEMVWSAAFSPDGKTLMTASYHSDEVIVHDLASWKTVAKLPHGGGSGVFAVAISRDGQWVATTTADALGLWRMGQYDSPVAQARISGTVWSVAFDPDSDALVTAGRQLERWRIVSPREGGNPRLESDRRVALDAHTVMPVVWRGDRCIAAATASALHLLCGSELKEVLRIPSPSSAAAVSRDGQRVVIGAPDGTLTDWALDQGADARRIALSAPIRRLAQSREKPWLAIAVDGAAVVILDARRWGDLKRLRLPADVDRLSVSADDRWLVASAGAAVRVFDTGNWEPVASVDPAESVTWLGFAPRSELLLMMAGNTVVGIDPQSWSERFRFVHQAPVQRLAFDADGARLTTVVHWAGGHDVGVRLTRVWDLASKQVLGWQFTSGSGNISRARMLELIREQRTSADGGDTGLVERAAAWPGESLTEPTEREISAGTWRASASARRMTLSDAKSHREIGSWDTGAEITGIAFVPTASPRWLLSTGSDGQLRLWPLLAEDLAAEACARLRAVLSAPAWTSAAASAPGETCISK